MENEGFVSFRAMLPPFTGIVDERALVTFIFIILTAPTLGSSFLLVNAARDI
jgi:hypothetical protein